MQKNIIRLKKCILLLCQSNFSFQNLKKRFANNKIMIFVDDLYKLMYLLNNVKWIQQHTHIHWHRPLILTNVISKNIIYKTITCLSVCYFFLTFCSNFRIISKFGENNINKNKFYWMIQSISDDFNYLLSFHTKFCSILSCKCEFCGWNSE